MNHSQFDQILLKHILTRNGLLNKYTLGSELSKANLVAMVMLNREREFFMLLLNGEREFFMVLLNRERVLYGHVEQREREFFMVLLNRERVL